MYKFGINYSIGAVVRPFLLENGINYRGCIHFLSHGCYLILLEELNTQSNE